MSDDTTAGETLILASKSAARRAMLENAGVAFQVCVAGVDEDAIKAASGDLDAGTLAVRLAEAKALAGLAELVADLHTILLRRAVDESAHEVFAVMRPGNERSAALARRLGMTWVGETDKYYGLHLQVHRLRPSDLG